MDIESRKFYVMTSSEFFNYVEGNCVNMVSGGILQSCDNCTCDKKHKQFLINDEINFNEVASQ